MVLNIIDKDMMSEIIKQCISIQKIQPIIQPVENKKSNTIVVRFNNENDTQLFLNDFDKTIMKTTYTYLQNQNKNPKEYNRNLVYTTLISPEDKNKLTISY